MSGTVAARCSDSPRSGPHAHEVVVAVAGVDVEIPAHRTEPVRGIQVRVGARVPRSAPQPFITILEQDLAQVVQVPCFDVQHVAEHALVHHAIDEHLVVIVVAILEMQAVAPRLLRRIHQRPQILERRADRTLAAAVLSVGEGGEHHGHVPLPGRGRINEIDVVARHELLEAVIARRVERGRGLALVGHHLRGAVGFVGDDVGERDDSHAVDREQLGQHRTAAQSRADDAEANRIVALEWHAMHGRTARWGRRCGVGGRRRCDVFGHGLREQAASGQSGAAEGRRFQEVAPRDVAHVGLLSCL